VVVDVANVMGARADGWWRDRAGAALRLGREVTSLARADPGRKWVLVLEGRARDAASALTREAAGAPVRVVTAPGSGDDTIVQVVVEEIARDDSCLVVTADRELRQRCEELSATVVGPGWLLGRL
jgi:8-oxo-dGTP diphosphatase